MSLPRLPLENAIDGERRLGKEAQSIPGQASMMWTQHSEADPTAMVN